MSDIVGKCIEKSQELEIRIGSVVHSEHVIEVSKEEIDKYNKEQREEFHARVDKTISLGGELAARVAMTMKEPADINFGDWCCGIMLIELGTKVKQSAMLGAHSYDR